MGLRYPNFGTLNIVNTDQLGKSGAPIAFPTTVAANGSWQSPLILACQGPGIVFALTSSEAGVILIQRYADIAGNVPVGSFLTGIGSLAPVQTPLTAGQPAWVWVNDGLPYLTFLVEVTNTTGTIANITDLALLTGPR